MEIISHRGYWKLKTEQNKKPAFIRSFENGFGVETDIRDYKGKLVVSHDMPNSEAMSLDVFFELYNFANISVPLALNIKADGLQNELMKSIKKNKIENYFLFDMSLPDLKLYVEKGFRTFLRLSEYETDLPFYDLSSGIWLDAFNNIWYSSTVIERHLNSGKTVCIVSAELHKRNYLIHWKLLIESGIYKMKNVILCTDFPILAKEYFSHEK